MPGGPRRAGPHRDPGATARRTARRRLHRDTQFPRHAARSGGAGRIATRSSRGVRHCGDAVRIATRSPGNRVPGPGQPGVWDRRSGVDRVRVQHEVIVELLDPQTASPCGPGTPGEVVVTALNPTYPLIRFGTGDLAVWAEGACGCGRTRPRLARILGRIGDAVKVRGMFLHPAEVDLAVARHPEVARYQVVVTRSGHNDAMGVRAELRAAIAAPTDLADRIAKTLAEIVRLRAEVEGVPAGTLAPDAKKIVDQRTWN